MRRPNHASRFEGIAKTNLQASRTSDTETLQSQVNKAAKKRLSLSGLEILHGRLFCVAGVFGTHTSRRLWRLAVPRTRYARAKREAGALASDRDRPPFD